MQMLAIKAASACRRSVAVPVAIIVL